MRILDLNPLNIGEVNGLMAPGLSSFHKGTWIHGQDAFSVCREDPQSILFSVWENLDVSGPSHPGGMRHSADVAMAQLKALLKNPSHGQWIVFTPSHWQKEQLQIFLGIAAECKMDVRALLPRALAVNHALGIQQDRWTAFEWHWHRLNRLHLKREDRGWGIERCETVPEGAVVDFFRRESRAVSRIALESQRVDPLHSGKTEQLLFKGWWNWHHQKTTWTYQAAGVDLDFSNESEMLSQLHRPWMNAHSISETDRTQSFPCGLGHCLGFATGHMEETDFSSIESRLGDLSTPGARRKDVLPCGMVPAQEPPPVTHWVVNGISEKISTPTNAKPGESCLLADGREALAIHVPESL